MIVAPIPIGLPISLLEPVEIIVFAMSFLKPHAICTILMFIPCMFIMMPCVLVTMLIFGFSALLVSILGQRCNWGQ